MKKVLFATTALVASAGIAAAEIEFGLSAEMGVFGGDRYEDDDLQFHNDFTITVDGSGETDNGLAFGLHVEIEESNGADEINGSASYDNEAVFISGSFGTLTLGEIDGAFDKRLQETALAAGTIADDETEHAGYNGNGNLDGLYDNQVLRYDYDFDSFGFSISAEQANMPQAYVEDAGANDADETYAIGFSYDADFGGTAVGFGLGYQTGTLAFDTDGDLDVDVYEDFDAIGASVHADFGNGFEVAVNYTDYDFDDAGDGEHIGIGIGYTMDALAIGLNYGEYDSDLGDSEGFGLAVNYDLGGGAVVQFGYGSSDIDDGDDYESYSLGIAMSF